MKYFSAVLFFILFFSVNAFTQKKKKNKKVEAVTVENIIPNLQQHIKILASDSFEGRRTGTAGEQLAASYIKNEFIKIGLSAKGENGGFFQTFEVNEGKEFEKYSTFYINDNYLQPTLDYFPLNISANGVLNEVVSPILKDLNTTWFLDLNEDLVKNQKNPHYDINPFIIKKVKELSAFGVKGLILYNSSSKLIDNQEFDKKLKIETEKIPVIYLTKEGFKKHIKTNNAVVEIKCTIEIKDKKRVGTNVISYQNNNAVNTIIIGAHYDHLGYGEDKNSLYAGKEKMIHNGADDNASGVAALIETARMLKANSSKKNNYLFITFSGEELGLYGSKYYTEHPTIDLTTTNYMVNMDMVGRLNDSTQTFTIGGYGTSPTWGQIIKETDKWNTLKVKFDSSGSGPSDHTSFYKKDIPVLFFFTGTHGDYHKPTDDYEKINFGGEEKIVQYLLKIVNATDALPKLVFTKTKENATGGTTRFTVSLGIMPDYTYSGTGVRADGISEGKLAQKIGLKTGDVLTKLGDFKITSVENYMQILSKFKKGDSAKLVTIREGKEINYDITF
jgi:aminopeptidase YwaD